MKGQDRFFQTICRILRAEHAEDVQFAPPVKLQLMGILDVYAGDLGKGKGKAYRVRSVLCSVFIAGSGSGSDFVVSPGKMSHRQVMGGELYLYESVGREDTTAMARVIAGFFHYERYRLCK